MLSGPAHAAVGRCSSAWCVRAEGRSFLYVYIYACAPPAEGVMVHALTHMSCGALPWVSSACNQVGRLEGHGATGTGSSCTNCLGQFTSIRWRYVRRCICRCTTPLAMPTIVVAVFCAPVQSHSRYSCGMHGSLSTVLQLSQSFAGVEEGVLYQLMHARGHAEDGSPSKLYLGHRTSLLSLAGLDVSQVWSLIDAGKLV